MAKKKAGNTIPGGAATGKAAARAAKKAKAAAKVERKEAKKAKSGKGKGGPEDEDDQDLEGILERMRREWEEAHKVTEEIASGPPSRRANATLTACPSGNFLWCIGGEFFSDDGKAHFYNDVYRYSPEKDEWRKFASPTCPGPRSAHAVVPSPISGGKLFLFGGEFSSLYQNSFHHYRDFWLFDIQTHTWERIEASGRGKNAAPCGRSGHRMAIWKHYIVLYGGFVDPGIRTQYLNDLWLFDTQEYKWHQIEFGVNDRKPSPRSGFSFLPVPEGATLHGGYCKEYTKGKRPVGVAMDDTWLLRLELPSADATSPTPATSSKAKAASTAISHLPITKWEKRKKIGYAPNPSPRSGCTMAYWTARQMGVMFGGVVDEEVSEEGLESVFLNDAYGYQTSGNGRWVGLALKKAKKKPGAGEKKRSKKEREGEGEDEGHNQAGSATQNEVDPNDPSLTLPLPRYNAMLAVLRNTLYIYGGIFERGAREYTLDDFYSLQLDKLERFVCLKESEVVPDLANPDADDSDEDGSEGGDESGGSDDEDDEIDDEMGDEHMPASTRREDDDDESEEEEEPDEMKKKAQAYLSATKTLPQPVKARDSKSKAETSPVVTSAAPNQENSEPEAIPAVDPQSTPLPFETLATFYARTREYWATRARNATASSSAPATAGGSGAGKGKALRTDGFGLAKERWDEYKPILEEVERILEQSGVERGEMTVVGVGGKGGGGPGPESRNRR